MTISKIIKQKNGEQVLLILRRHWIAFIPVLGLFIFMHIVALGMYAFVAIQFPDILETNSGRALTIILTSLLLLSAWLQMYGQFIDFYLDMWVVTNTRIISIEQHGLFGRTISEIDLYKIQDVTSEINGFIPTTFKYGFINIQSAGEISRFTFEQVPHPNIIRKTIIQLVQKDRKKHALETSTSDI